MKTLIQNREEYNAWRVEQETKYNLDPYWKHVPKKYPCLIISFDIIEKYESKDTLVYEFIYIDDLDCLKN